MTGSTPPTINDGYEYQGHPEPDHRILVPVNQGRCGSWPFRKYVLTVIPNLPKAISIHPHFIFI